MFSYLSFIALIIENEIRFIDLEVKPLGDSKKEMKCLLPNELKENCSRKLDNQYFVHLNNGGKKMVCEYAEHYCSCFEDNNTNSFESKMCDNIPSQQNLKILTDEPKRHQILKEELFCMCI